MQLTNPGDEVRINEAQVIGKDPKGLLLASDINVFYLTTGLIDKVELGDIISFVARIYYPVIRNSYGSLNISQRVSEIVFGETELPSKSVYPGCTFTGDIYLFFGGGNTSYYQFTILDDSHIIPTVSE